MKKNIMRIMLLTFMMSVLAISSVFAAGPYTPKNVQTLLYGIYFQSDQNNYTIYDNAGGRTVDFATGDFDITSNVVIPAGHYTNVKLQVVMASTVHYKIEEANVYSKSSSGSTIIYGAAGPAVLVPMTLPDGWTETQANDAMAYFGKSFPSGVQLNVTANKIYLTTSVGTVDIANDGSKTSIPLKVDVTNTVFEDGPDLSTLPIAIHL